MKLNNLEVTAKGGVRANNALIVFTVEGSVSDILNEITAGHTVVTNGNVVYGDYSVFGGACVNIDGSVTVTLKKPETWRDIIARLEEENAALRDELLDTQEALAELVEGGMIDEEEGGEQNG